MTTDLKNQQKILPFDFLKKYHFIIFLRLLKAALPVFDKLKLAILIANMNERTNKMSFE